MGGRCTCQIPRPSSLICHGRMGNVKQKKCLLSGSVEEETAKMQPNTKFWIRFFSFRMIRFTSAGPNEQFMQLRCQTFMLVNTNGGHPSMDVEDLSPTTLNVSLESPGRRLQLLGTKRLW